MPLQPYEGRVYDNSAATRRMTDLVRDRGAMQAELALRQGETAANLASDLAGIGQRTMADLVRAKEAKAAGERQDRLDQEAAEDRAQRRTLVGRQIKASDDQMAAQGREEQFRAVFNEFAKTGLSEDQVARYFTDKGMADKIPQVMQTLTTVRKQSAEALAIRREALADMGHLTALSGDTVEGFLAAAGEAVKSGLLSEAEVTPYIAQVAAAEARGQAPVMIADLTRQLKGLSKRYAEKAPELMNVPQGNTVIDKSSGREVYSAPSAPARPVNVSRGGQLVDPTKGTVVYRDERGPASGGGGDSDAPKPLTNAQRQSANGRYQRALAEAEENAQRAIASERTRLLRDSPDTNLDADPAFQAFKADAYARLEQDKARAQRAYREDIQWMPSGNRPQPTDQMQRGAPPPPQPQPAPVDPRQRPAPQAMGGDVLEARANELAAKIEAGTETPAERAEAERLMAHLARRGR